MSQVIARDDRRPDKWFIPHGYALGFVLELVAEEPAVLGAELLGFAHHACVETMQSG